MQLRLECAYVGQKNDRMTYKRLTREGKDRVYHPREMKFRVRRRVSKDTHIPAEVRSWINNNFTYRRFSLNINLFDNKVTAITAS